MSGLGEADAEVMHCHNGVWMTVHAVERCQACTDVCGRYEMRAAGSFMD